MKFRESAPQPALDPPAAADVLAALHAASRSEGLTPGKLRAVLAARTGSRCDLREVRAACHELWLRNQVVIEPPGRDRKEYRVWHAAHRPLPGARSGGERPPPPGRTSRESDPAEHFRISCCGQLAGEWSRTRCQDTREVLRRLLSNFGAEPVEQAGEVVPFKGRRHESDTPVPPGARVRVTEPGWVLRQGLGEYLLAKARVVPV